MATSILAYLANPTPTVAPEGLDDRYPVPSWADEVHGSYGVDERDGWGWDQTEFTRCLYWTAGYVSIGVAETCAPDGRYIGVEHPCVILPEDSVMDAEVARIGAKPVIKALLRDLCESFAQIHCVQDYVDHMTQLIEEK